MGYFDDIVRPDGASSYFPTPPGVPRITVRPSSDQVRGRLFETGAVRPPRDEGVEPPAAPPQIHDMPADVGLASDPFAPWGAGEAARGNVAPTPRAAGRFDDIVAPAAQHKATIERALSTTVPLRLQHPHAVEIASELMADHGIPLDEALDRATMRLHADEGTAEAGKISDVIGKDAFDEAQRAPASPDLAQPAPGLGQGRASTERQARPDGEYASGDRAPQGGDAAGEKTIGSEGAGATDNRARSRDELTSAAAKGEGGDQGLALGRNDAIVARPSGEQYILPTNARIGDEEYGQRVAQDELNPKREEEPPPTEADIPYYDPLTGMPMPAPRLPPQSPGLPVRPETQAPLNTPPSGWPDLPVTAPRFGVPLAVPDPNARGEGFPSPPGPTAMDRIKAAAAHGFGDEPLGFSAESRAKYPNTFLRWQPFAAPLDFAVRAPGAATGAVSSAGSEIYKALGGTETDANRLERDLNILGQGAMVEGGIGNRYNIGKPQANLLRTREGALSNEAAAPRGAIAATVSPAPLRQILAEASEQGVPNPRAGPQPPARPPDNAAVQSDRTRSEARESGPFSLEGREQAVKTGDVAAVTRNALKGRAFEEEKLGDLAATHTKIRRQVSVRPYVDASGTLADYIVRLDAISIDGKGVLQLTDFKSSRSARYTRNQKRGYPLLKQYGGQVVGKKGGEHYRHGFQIEPTEVTTIKPPDFKVKE